ncbi:MAG: ABC transporter permease subunit [Caldilineaceae bacterium]
MIYDLMRSLRAARWQLFRLLELPAALPVLLSGLKLSVILAVVGAVVGEFVGADVGLGFLINPGAVCSTRQ